MFSHATCAKDGIMAGEHLVVDLASKNHRNRYVIVQRDSTSAAYKNISQYKKKNLNT